MPQVQTLGVHGLFAHVISCDFTRPEMYFVRKFLCLSALPGRTTHPLPAGTENAIPEAVHQTKRTPTLVTSMNTIFISGATGRLWRGLHVIMDAIERTARQKSATAGRPSSSTTAPRPTRAGRAPQPRRGRPLRNLRAALQLFIAILAFCFGHWCLAHWSDIRHCLTLDLHSAYRSQLPVTVTDASGIKRILAGEPWCTLGEVPPELLRALVAAEDKRFWSRWAGVDGRALLRAFWQSLRGQSQGGSTLPMQCARSSFDLPGGSMSRSLTRKFLEMIVATRLEHEFTKEQILELYLNTANFGGQKGLRAAARKYFNRAPRELQPPQFLWLISTLPRPTGRGKEADTVKALERVQTTASKIVQDARVSPAAIGLYPGDQELDFTRGRSRRELPAGLAGEIRRSFTPQSWNEVRQLGGANVTLTLDFGLQSALQSALTADTATLARKLLPSNPDDLMASLVVLDARTGAVLACLGSRNRDAELSCATQSSREPGSTLKPFELATALEAGNQRPDSVVYDLPIAPGALAGMPVQGAWPGNADGRYLGAITLQTAFERSRNPVFVAISDTIRTPLDTMLRRMHIGYVQPETPAQFIVGRPVTLLDLTAAYAPFANGGEWHRPFIISQVAAANGRSVFNASVITTRVMSPPTADAVYSAMQGVLQRGTAQSLHWLPGGGKTGTTSADGGGRSRDLRFVYCERGTGNRRPLVIGLWVGADRGAIENPEATSRHVLAMAGHLIDLTRKSSIAATLGHAWIQKDR